LRPFVEIGVAPARDHDETQQVRRAGDLLDQGRAGLGGQDELEQSQRLAALRHRGQHRPAVLARTTPDSGASWRQDLDQLSAESLFGRTTIEGLPLRQFPHVAS
jgi:hypothetical protein